jgi:hypothetical protein
MHEALVGVVEIETKSCRPAHSLRLQNVLICEFAGLSLEVALRHIPINCCGRRYSPLDSVAASDSKIIQECSVIHLAGVMLKSEHAT